jgi:alkanesulfonate monooxygenase SsuD/methylene tetrahydromethanopterin reductase-like flavin-dependent oxidoreductase (luciferase family)
MPPIKFGYCLPIFANPSPGLFRTPNYQQLSSQTTLALGVHAEELGFDSLWVADHLMLGKDEAIMEGWTTLSALGGATSRAQIGMIHQAHFFRSPALMAKMAATLDQITGGRFILFYDYGHQKREHLNYHLPYPEDVDVRAADVLDGLSLMLQLWAATEPLTVQIGQYGVTDAVCSPGPVQQPHPPIWFGEANPTLLDACARIGQGWNTVPVAMDELDRRLTALKTACDNAGTAYDSIAKSLELQVLIAPEGEVQSTLGKMLDLAPDQSAVDPELRRYANGERGDAPASLADITAIGTPEQVRAQLQTYIDKGISHFLLWFLDAPDRNGMELFAREVAPHVRNA